VTGDGPWWVVIDLDLPYTGGEVLEPGRVRIPFATAKSARRAAQAVKVSVRRDPEVITGTVIGQEAISPGPAPGGLRACGGTRPGHGAARGAAPRRGRGPSGAP
jgi:hypothetical protein